jgi:hypothetical protein
MYIKYIQYTYLSEIPVVRGPRSLTQLLRCQHLYFGTSKASKLRIPVVRGPRSLTRNLQTKPSPPIKNAVSPPDMRNKK